MNFIKAVIHLLTIISLIFSIKINASSYEQDSLTAKVINEGYIPEVKVSGRVLMGALTTTESKPKNDSVFQQLYLWLPKKLPSESSVCISLNSRDGQYSARLSASLSNVSNQESKAITINYISKEPEYYKTLSNKSSPYELSALVELKRDCKLNTEPEGVLIASSEPFNALRSIIIMANSSRMETLLAVPVMKNKTKKHLGVLCQPIVATHRIAFDTVCTLDIDKINIQGQADFTKMQLIRRRGGSMADSIVVELLI